MIPAFSIWYADGSRVDGATKADWRAAPAVGVQVVVRWREPEVVRWGTPDGPIRDREIWTGDDSYDPFGWGEKIGTLIDDAAYKAIWREAVG